MAKPKVPQRSHTARQDLGSIPSITYVDSAGAQKNMGVEPGFLRATAAGENIGAGRLVKISASPYTLELKDKAYDVTALYQIGDIVTNAGKVYMNTQPVEIAEAFDSEKWIAKADSVIAGIVSVAGTIVSTGR